jgi:hypothetical protein
MYAPGDARVTGLVLANPWVRTQTSEAQAYMRHYYGARVLSRDFWRKLASGGVHPLASLRSLCAYLRSALSRGGGSPEVSTPFPARMLEGLERFRGRVLLVPRATISRPPSFRCGARIAALAQGARLGARCAP